MLSRECTRLPAVPVPAVPVPAASAGAVPASRLAVAVALRRARGAALGGRRLASGDRGLDLDALAEHVVVAVLQHLLGAVIALESDETETAGLMVVRITHH